MRGTTSYEGYEIWIDVYGDGIVKLRAEDVPGEFTCPEKLLAAIKAQELAKRKGFINPNAWVAESPGYNQERIPMAVEVTSVSQDGKEVFVRRTKHDGAGTYREKIAISKLYADGTQVQAALDFQARARKETEAAWAAVEPWTPIWPEGKP